MDFMINSMPILAHKWMKFMRCKGPHNHFEHVHLCTGIGRFSMKSIFKRWFLWQIWLCEKLLFTSMFYKNSYFQNTLFENSDRKSKEKDKEEDHCSDKDKIYHLFYPLEGPSVFFKKNWQNYERIPLQSTFPESWCLKADKLSSENSARMPFRKCFVWEFW